MDLMVLLGTGVFLFVVLIMMLVAGRHRSNTPRSDQLLLGSHLPWDAAIAAVVQSRVRSQTLVGLGAMAAGLALGAVAALLLGDRLPDLTSLQTVGVFGFLGALLGHGIHTLVLTSPWPVSQVRVAHSTVPRLRDYIHRGVPLTARLAMVTTVAMLGITVQLPQWQGSGFGRDQSGVVWAVLLTVLLGWGFVEVVARRIITRPHHPTSSLGVAWEDTLRANDMFWLFVRLGWVTFFSVSLVGNALPASTARMPLGFLFRMALLGSGIAGLMGPMIAHFMCPDPIMQRWKSPEIKIDRRTGLPVPEPGRR